MWNVYNSILTFNSILIVYLLHVTSNDDKEIEKESFLEQM